MLFILAFGVLHPGTAAAEDAPIAHWKLTANTEDSSPAKRSTSNHDVVFTAKGPDGSSPAAVFNGQSSRLEVTEPKLGLGSGDFTISVWVHTDESMDDDLGDLLSCYDPEKRVGFILGLRTNSGVTGSQANTRQLQFGIDAGTVPHWRDEGRPGDAVLAFALAVHDGHLYAGTCTNAEGGVGRVYRYGGSQKWIDCGAPDACNAVSALAVHQGHLYAGTARYRFSGSSLKESPNTAPGGGVFRYEKDGKWSEVGRLPETVAIGGLVVYRGQLYASSLYPPAGFFRYEREGIWTSLPTPGGKRVEPLAVHNGAIWAGSYDSGRVYRYDAAGWTDLGLLGQNTQTYAFAVYRGQLCVGTWPSGRVYAWNSRNWQDLGQLGQEQEVMGMIVHNGKLYGGTLPRAEVYRFDGPDRWTSTGQLDLTPDVRFRRAWTMAQYNGRLFCSTLPSGHIHSLNAGICVTYDREFPPGWRHVAAVKAGNKLLLYLDGQEVAASSSFDPTSYDLKDGPPLLIGAGAGDHFKGALTDLRIYRRALPVNEIRDLARRSR